MAERHHQRRASPRFDSEVLESSVGRFNNKHDETEESIVDNLHSLCIFLFLSLHTLSLCDLDRLLDYIPSVHHLTVRLFTDLQNCSKDAHTEKTRSISSNVRLLKISIINNLPFNQIDALFRHRFTRLERLTFEFRTDASSQSCLDYVDEQRWQCLLDTLLSLEQFHCCLQVPVDCESTARSISRSAEANDGFLQRRWKCAIETYTYSYSTNVRIHTRPYPKRRLVTTWVSRRASWHQSFILLSSLQVFPRRRLPIRRRISMLAYVIFIYWLISFHEQFSVIYHKLSMTMLHH